MAEIVKNSLAADYIGKRVSVTLRDGRHYVGILATADAHLNLMLSEGEQRMYPETSVAEQGEEPPATEVDPLGVVMVRGANIACLGLVDTVAELDLDVPSLTCRTLPAE